MTNKILGSFPQNLKNVKYVFDTFLLHQRIVQITFT